MAGRGMDITYPISDLSMRSFGRMTNLDAVALEDLRIYCQIRVRISSSVSAGVEETACMVRLAELDGLDSVPSLHHLGSWTER
jgi:hypothetical protein